MGIKLYTEEQISVAINAAKANPEQAYLIQAMLTPIELPSDEEISEVAMVVCGFDARNIKDVLEYKAFKRGAKFVINKIQGGNK